jgi:hypothetical protein
VQRVADNGRIADPYPTHLFTELAAYQFHQAHVENCGPNANHSRLWFLGSRHDRNAKRLPLALSSKKNKVSNYFLDFPARWFTLVREMEQEMADKTEAFKPLNESFHVFVAVTLLVISLFAAAVLSPHALAFIVAAFAGGMNLGAATESWRWRNRKP